MSKLTVILAALVVALALGGCSSSGDKHSTDYGSDGKWSNNQIKSLGDEADKCGKIAEKVNETGKGESLDAFNKCMDKLIQNNTSLPKEYRDNQKSEAAAGQDEASDGGGDDDAVDDVGEADAAILEYGQTWHGSTYDVTIGKPVKFQLSEEASAEKAPAYAAFTVTIKNPTHEVVDPSEINISASVGNREATEVVDSDSSVGDVGTAPGNPLLPGRSVTYKVGFGIYPGSSVTLSLMDWNDTDQQPIWDGTIK